MRNNYVYIFKGKSGVQPQSSGLHQGKSQLTTTVSYQVGFLLCQGQWLPKVTHKILLPRFLVNTLSTHISQVSYSLLLSRQPLHLALPL